MLILIANAKQQKDQKPMTRNWMNITEHLQFLLWLFDLIFICVTELIFILFLNTVTLIFLINILVTGSTYTIWHSDVIIIKFIHLRFKIKFSIWIQVNIRQSFPRKLSCPALICSQETFKIRTNCMTSRGCGRNQYEL